MMMMMMIMVLQHEYRFHARQRPTLRPSQLALVESALGSYYVHIL